MIMTIIMIILLMMIIISITITTLAIMTMIIILIRLDLDLALGLPPEAAAEDSEDDTGIISSGLSEEVLEESPRASRSPTWPPRVGWEDEVASMFAEEQRELRARAERELTRRMPSSLSAVSAPPSERRSPGAEALLESARRTRKSSAGGHVQSLVGERT